MQNLLFVVFAPAIERTILVERLERLYGTFKYPYRNDNVNCHISTSIGAAIFPGDGDNYETILDHADCALYEAKKNGRSQYVLYEPHMQGNSGKNEPAGEEEVR